MDDLDNFDVDDFDFDNAKSPTPPPKRKQDDAGLGIDEEIDITKRARVPAVKLDEKRLLSDKGIPKLRQRARKLKFKGKGHEYSDTAQLLSFYQFWLDDLFPKAKFLDALAMVEKLGHKKMVYRKRTEWIDELKPRHAGEEDAVMTTTIEAAEDEAAPREPAKLAPIFEKKNTGERQQTPPMDDDDLFGDDDLHGLTPRVERATIRDDKPSNATNSTTAPAASSIFGPAITASKGPAVTKSGFIVDDDEDDLDALMAEAEAHGSGPSKPQPLSTVKPAAPEPDDFADEEAAMAEMEGF